MTPTLLALCAFVSVYSVFACVLVTAEILVRKVTNDPFATSRWLNRNFAFSTWRTWLVQIFSGLAVVAWVAIVLPWIDFFTVRWFVTYVPGGGLVTYFGEVSGESTDLWFIIGLFNILAAKAAPNMIELFVLLRQGPVIRIPLGIFSVWAPLRT